MRFLAPLYIWHQKVVLYYKYLFQEFLNVEYEETFHYVFIFLNSMYFTYMRKFCSLFYMQLFKLIHVPGIVTRRPKSGRLRVMWHRITIYLSYILSLADSTMYHLPSVCLDFKTGFQLKTLIFEVYEILVQYFSASQSPIRLLILFFFCSSIA